MLQLPLLILISKHTLSFALSTRSHSRLLANMKSSTIIPVSVLATLGQATWPSPLGASNLTTHGISAHPQLETISLPSVPSTWSSTSSRRVVEAHTLSSVSTAHSLSASPSGAAFSVSSLPTIHSLSSHQSVVAHSDSSPSLAYSSSSHHHIVYHTLPSPPMTHDSSSRPSAVSHTHTSLSPAHNTSSSPPATSIALSSHSSARNLSSQPFTATISVVDIRPSATPCVCHGDHHDPSCCHEETRLQTITRLVLIAVPTTVVDYDGKTRTVTKDKLRTVTTIQPDACTATVVDYKTHYTCKKPTPTIWAPPRIPIRPYPSIVLDTSRKPGPTPWDPPRKPHGTVRPYPTDDKKKHHKPTYTISVFGPETTCPVGFTCQPDDHYVKKKLAIREAHIPWPAPPGCANHCVGGEGCWTECDKPDPKDPSRVCPEGYSCQRKKKQVSAPVTEHPEQQPPHKQLPAPAQQPAPPVAYPEPPLGPAPMPPLPPFIPPPVVPPPSVAASSAVLPPLVPPPAVPIPPAAPPVVPPPPVLPSTVGQPPATSRSPVSQPPAAPVHPSTHVETASEVSPAPSHHCPAGEHPCPHLHANETVGAPRTVTKAGANLDMPGAAMAMIFACGFGLFMV